MKRKDLLHPAFGIDISDFSVEIAGITRTYTKPRVSSYGRILLDKGIVEDGIIKKPDALAGFLKKVFANAKPHALRSKLCSVSIPESQVLMYHLKLPRNIGSSVLRKTILHEVSKNLPINIQDVYFDYQVVGFDQHNKFIFFAAAKKTFIHMYIDVLQKASLFPLAFEVEPISIFRSLHMGAKKGVVAVIDAGAKNTKAYIFKNGNFVAHYTVNSGGEDITESISRNLHLSNERSEKIKKQYGLDPDAREGCLFKAILPLLNKTASELKTFFNHYKIREKESIRKIYMIGGASLLTGAQDFFTTVFEQKAERPNLLDRIQTKSLNIGRNDAMLYANVFGVSLRGIEKEPYGAGINLLSQARYKT